MSRALARLVGLFPAPFREQFGRDLQEQIERDGEQARARGRGAVAWFVFSTALDLVRSALAERLQPSWPGRLPPAAEGPRMRSMIQGWGRDLRHATRALQRAPGFTAVAVITLGLALGANAGMFGVVSKVLLEPFPYDHPDRLVHIAASAPGSDFPEEFGVAQEFYVQYDEQSRLLEDVSTYNSFTATLRADDRVERIRMSWPTNSLYRTLGATPILGRLPSEEDEENAIVISHALWTTWFGGDSSAIGRSYDVAGSRRTVIGVMGPAFQFPNDGTLLWISSTIRPEGITPGRFGSSLVARMAPGATPSEVADELTALARRLPERFGGSPAYARLIERHRAIVRPLDEELLGSASRSLWVLFGAVGIVLLLACANVANLFLVRAEGRQRDLAVRRAIGAGGGHLIRLQLAEALLVGAMAAGVAMLLALLGLPVFLRAAPPGIPRIDETGLDGTTLLMTLAAALLAGIACGVVPAVRASRPDLARLRDGGRGATRGRLWTRNGLVAGQSALALVLLIGSGLLVRSFWKLRHVDAGYDPRDVFTFQIAPEGAHLDDGPTYARFNLEFMERLRALPGVQAVGLVENLPLNEGTRLAPFRTEEVAADPDAGERLRFTWAAGDYFRAMGIGLLAGRTFVPDDQRSFGNVVISRSAAEQLWPGADPIGRRVQQAGDSVWHTVVGMVEDVRQNDYREAPHATLYFPMVGPTPTSWVISSPAFVVKTPRAGSIGPEVRALVRQLAPSAPMYRVFTMEGLVADSMVQLSFTMLTLGVLSVLALILGAVGLYGVLSYVVAERTREIGVRMALGARAEQVRRMVVTQGAQVVAVGVVLGVGAALAGTRLLGTLLYGVAGIDAATFLGMSGSMVVVGLLASYLPARRASSVDPMESLRSE